MPIRRGEKKTPVVTRGFFSLVALSVLLFDQLTKFWALRLLKSGISAPLIPRIFHLTLVENEGIAFGLLPGIDKILLVAITLSIIILIFFGLRMDPQRWTSQWGIGLILGGALGNWVDRVRVGAVVDFLDFRIWPVFNFADTAITIGVGLFFLEMLKKRDHVS